ncbi:MAG: type II secretion system protein [Candidatus Wildermuthbacteria bacterium]|nr:type II secretion system protein [Candidatus Wildermuthbacteria bacterium]
MNNKEKGTTILEVAIYIAVLAIIVAAVGSLLLWAIRSQTKARVLKETTLYASNAMDAMTRKIREAQSIYEPTTSLNQLSLETAANPPIDESSTYVDLFLCDTRICLKREGENPVPLTSEELEVQTLEFREVTTTFIPSVEITLEAQYKNPSAKPELTASARIVSTVSFRAY